MSKSHLKIRTGLLIKGTTSYPSDPEEGDIVFRSDLFKYSIYRNSNWADLQDSRLIQVLATTDSTTTGSNATVASTPTPFIRLTNASLISLNGIAAAGDGVVVTLTNALATPITIYDDTGGTVANRIRTGTNKPLRLKNNASITVIYDGTSSRWRIVGGAGGSGTGDSYSFIEEMKDALTHSFYEWMTPNLFILHEQTLVNGSTTATYDVTNDAYAFTAAQFLLSTQHFGSRFLANTSDAASAEVQVLWNTIPTTFTTEVSRDGGLNWLSLTMDRVGDSKKYKGYGSFLDPVTLASLYTYAVGNADSVNEFNATTQQSMSMPFTVAASSKQKSTKITTYLNRSATAPDGVIRARIVKDSGGVPSTNSADLIAESSQMTISTIASGDSSVIFNFSSILPTGNYHLVLEPDAAYKATFFTSTKRIAWRTDTSAPTYGDTTHVYNGTSWSALTTNASCFLIEGIPYDLRVRITDTAGTGSLLGYGVLYGEAGTGLVTGDDAIQTFRFDGASNTYEFTITQFLPDPKFLKVFDVNTGQIYRYPAFTLDGHKVVFASGTFLRPGEQVVLIFDQSSGSGFDNSDANAALMAANHLGSTDATIDRSIVGRGIILRRPDGTLREISLDNSDGIVISSVP